MRTCLHVVAILLLGGVSFLPVVTEANLSYEFNIWGSRNPHRGAQELELIVGTTNGAQTIPPEQIVKAAQHWNPELKVTIIETVVFKDIHEAWKTSQLDVGTVVVFDQYLLTNGKFIGATANNFIWVSTYYCPWKVLNHEFGHLLVSSNETYIDEHQSQSCEGKDI